MKYFGAHVSAAAASRTHPATPGAIGATAFALFTKNQRQWSAPALTAEQVAAFPRRLRRVRLCACADSAPRQLPDQSGPPRRRSARKVAPRLRGGDGALRGAGTRPAQLPSGSHLRQIAPEESLDRIAASINRALDRTHGVTAVIENTAGQGSNLGFRFHIWPI